MAMVGSLVGAASIGIALTLVMGCRVDTEKKGDHDNVKIATPFGGISVKTNDSVSEGSTGLSVYPGAVLAKKEKNNEAADVNMSFGSFHLGVKVAGYTSTDAPDKVLAFYRKDMAHFGAVILCEGNHAVGTPDHTGDGLTCDQDRATKVRAYDDSYEQQLRAGSKQHQHIVAINTEGVDTKFALIELDLPRGLKDDNQEEQ
jgi:hypothetical protein